MSIYTYNDTVKVIASAPSELRPGEPASVVAISEEVERKGKYLERFPHGVVYLIEFEDGSSVQAHESLLEKGAFPGELI